MARDIMYYFDKQSPYQRHELGEIQTNFNMSLVIDGGKDSKQVDIFNYIGNQIEANTILHHNATDTWWVVKRDIVKRYQNELGFYYHHSLTLLGAIDLLNNRDLTDCGFNDKTYTIGEFILRLFKLSTFEFNVSINSQENITNIDLNKKTDFIKSYENYTLLSALRDILSAYNCDAKLSFSAYPMSGNYYLTNTANLKIIPKTGDVSLPFLDIDDFDDVRETISQSKESFGTTVISNTQNLTSTLAKTYPQIGGVGLNADAYKIDNMSKGYLKLPAPAYKVNWVKAISPIRLKMFQVGNQTHYSDLFYPQNKTEFEYYFEQLLEWARASQAGTAFADYILSKKEEIRERAIGCSGVTFFSDFTYNPQAPSGSRFTEGPNTPYFAELYYKDGSNEGTYVNVLADKQTYDTIEGKEKHGLYWERGSDKIQGFETIGNAVGPTDDSVTGSSGNTIYANHTDLILFGYQSQFIRNFEYQGDPYGVGIEYSGTDLAGLPSVINHIGLKHTVWQINYIPMTDVKIKQDNENYTLDSQVYNQNGKLNDSVALSKMIDSYSKEIESPTITRFMEYDKFTDVPKIGQIVKSGDKKYVINNISLDFYPNESSTENVNYKIDCEFTLAEYVATKSVLTNPNSNIRDYGIPQKYNVKRRQVYRDYYDFSYTFEHYDTPYCDISNYIWQDIGKVYDHTAIIKVTYDEQVDGHTEWFYQLSTTAYVMNRSIYEIVDFNDNNIIGYDMQNHTTGFNMSDLWNPNKNQINTPVSYVDDKGRAKGFYLAMVNKDNLMELYSNIQESLHQTTPYMLSAHCFVGSEMYYGANGTITNLTFSAGGNYSTVERPATGMTSVRIPLDDFEFVDSGGNVISIDDIELDTLVLSDLSIEWTNGQQTITGTISSWTIVTQTNIKYLAITDSSGYYDDDLGWDVNVSLKASYVYTTGVYQGAVDICDYEVNDPNYNKDAIEVPVFEYSLQVGDTKEIETGDRIVGTSEDDIEYMYVFATADKNKASKLNAGNYATQDITHTEPTSAVDSYQVSNSVAVTFVKENGITKKLSMSFYDTALMLITKEGRTAVNNRYGNKTNEWVLNNIVGKDLLVYRYAIRSVDASVVDKQLMFILHNVPQSIIDTESPLGVSKIDIFVNHYRLS